MSNLNDFAHDMFPLEGVSPPVDRQPDAEFREVVLRFERIFAELEPHSEDRSATAAAGAASTTYLDFPDDVASALEEAGPGNGTVPVQPRDRREPELANKPGAQIKGRAARTSGPNARLDVAEAISILLEAEARGKAAAAREARDEDEKEEDPLSSARSPVNSRSKLMTDPSVAPKLAEPAGTPKVVEPAVKPKIAEPAAIAVNPEWSAKSRTLWTMALIAGSVALVIGTGVGYLMGRGHEAQPNVAKIQSSPEGGAKLRADYDLRRR